MVASLEGGAELWPMLERAPAELTRLELTGYLGGPLAYLRSRRLARKTRG